MLAEPRPGELSAFLAEGWPPQPCLGFVQDSLHLADVDRCRPLAAWGSEGLLGLVSSKLESDLVDGGQAFSSSAITMHSTALRHEVEVEATYRRHPESP